MKPRYIPPDLKPGDACWLLRGTLLYEVTIAEANTYLAGERSEFKLYKIACEHATHLERDSQHRSDLFMRPAERAQLIEQIDSNIDSLEYMKKDLEEEEREELRAAEERAERASERIVQLNNSEDGDSTALGEEDV